MSSITKIAEIKPGSTDLTIEAKVLGDTEIKHITINDRPHD